MARLLIVDDEETIRRLLEGAFKRKDHEVMTVEDGVRGCDALVKFAPDVIISDIKMPKMDGFQMIERMRAENGKNLPPFVFITGHGDKAAAVEALRRGAFDYLEKPFEMDEIHHVVERAIERSRLAKDNGRLSDELKTANEKLAEKLEARTELVRRMQHPKEAAATDANPFTMETLGDSLAMAPVRGAIDRLTKSALGANMSVLITGPSGAGKEIVARMLHELSQRKDGPWVPLNCAAFPENLIEAELFGYEKGAFTGAGNRKPGVFEMADGGTLFLDEIGELPLNLQAKLLRALQEQTFRRVGGTQELKVNVRVIAATNKDLKKCAEQKTFREDLFYRLNSLPIILPGLKARGEADIQRLAKYFLEQTVVSTNSSARRLNPDAEAKLTSYEWPGNVRELKAVIQRAALLCDGDVIDGRAIDAALGNHPSAPIQLVPANGAASRVAMATPPEENLGGMSYHEWKRSVVMRMEKQYLQQQLEHFHGNVSAMSRSMKVTRPNLCRLLKKHALVAENYRKHDKAGETDTAIAA